MSDNEEPRVRQYSVRIDTQPTAIRWSGRAGGPLEAAAFAYIQAMKSPELCDAMIDSEREYFSVAELDDAGEVRLVVSVKWSDASNAAKKRIRYQRKLVYGDLRDYLS